MTDVTRPADEPDETNLTIDPDPALASDPTPRGGPAPADLVGRWQAAALRVDGQRRRVPARMMVTMEFKQSGLLAVEAGRGETRHVRFGTYLVHGQRLILNLEGYTQIMGFGVKAQRLTLKKPVSPPEVLYLKRLAA